MTIRQPLVIGMGRVGSLMALLLSELGMQVEAFLNTTTGRFLAEPHPILTKYRGALGLRALPEVQNHLGELRWLRGGS